MVLRQHQREGWHTCKGGGVDLSEIATPYELGPYLAEELVVSEDDKLEAMEW